MFFPCKKLRDALKFILVFYLVLPLFIAACSSRYRASLYLMEESRRRRVVVREAFYVAGLGVTSAYSADFLTPMPGSLGAAAFFTRESGDSKAGPSSVIGSRKHIEYRLIAPLPENPTVGTMPLNNKAFVRKLSFENTDEAWQIYLFSAGHMTLDSIKKSNWHTTIAATFRNQDGDSVRIEGQMKLKKRDTFAFEDTRYERTR